MAGAGAEATAAVVTAGAEAEDTTARAVAGAVAEIAGVEAVARAATEVGGAESVVGDEQRLEELELGPRLRQVLLRLWPVDVKTDHIQSTDPHTIN